MEDTKPWDQQPGEPDAAYKRFLVYRNLGPGRSLTAAAAVNGVNERRKRASGSWYGDSVNFDWVRRANLWDVHVLNQAGAALVSEVVELYRVRARMLINLVNSSPDQVRPKNATEFDTALNTVAGFVTPEAVEAAQSLTADHRGRDGQPQGEGASVDPADPTG